MANDELRSCTAARRDSITVATKDKTWVTTLETKISTLEDMIFDKDELINDLSKYKYSRFFRAIA